MSIQLITSDLFVDLSTEAQQLLAGGKSSDDYDDDQSFKKCMKKKGCWKWYKKCKDRDFNDD